MRGKTTTVAFQRLKVVVVGQGYVGLPLAMRAIEVGREVIGVEIDDSRVKRLGNGDSFVEDVSSEQLRAALASGRYKPTVDLHSGDEFDVAVIAVPTPLIEGVPRLGFIEDAGRHLAPADPPWLYGDFGVHHLPGNDRGIAGPDP